MDKMLIVRYEKNSKKCQEEYKCVRKSPCSWGIHIYLDNLVNMDLGNDTLRREQAWSLNHWWDQMHPEKPQA